jgi:hypothetical protein
MGTKNMNLANFILKNSLLAIENLQNHFFLLFFIILIFLSNFASKIKAAKE